MHLKLTRLISNPEETIGVLYKGSKFLGFTLEDEFRRQKVYSETRIPAGKYEIKLRTNGGMHGRYSVRFPKLHKGMLELQDVPNFTYIYIHIGNKDEDTAGCILVGDAVNYDFENPRFTLTKSTVCYLRLYEQIIEVLNKGKQIFIEIIDND